jgi:hypothetical protein
MRPRGGGRSRGPRTEDRRPHPRRDGDRNRCGSRLEHVVDLDRPARRAARAAVEVSRHALLQPRACVDARRDRARRLDRRHARGGGARVGARDRQDPHRRHGCPGLRVLAARRRPRAGGDPDARRRCRVGRGHRRRDDARVQASGRAASADRHRRSRCAPRHRRVPLEHARRTLRPARPAAPHGRRGQARPQDRRGLLPVGRAVPQICGLWRRRSRRLETRCDENRVSRRRFAAPQPAGNDDDRVSRRRFAAPQPAGNDDDRVSRRRFAAPQPAGHDENRVSRRRFAAPQPAGNDKENTR